MWEFLRIHDGHLQLASYLWLPATITTSDYYSNNLAILLINAGCLMLDTANIKSRCYRVNGLLCDTLQPVLKVRKRVACTALSRHLKTDYDEDFSGK